MSQKREFRPQPDSERPDYPEEPLPEPSGDDEEQSTPTRPVVRMPGAPMVPDRQRSEETPKRRWKLPWRK